jgi:hypothetical protein
MRRIAKQFRGIKRRDVIPEEIMRALKCGPGGVNDEGAQPKEDEDRLRPPNVGAHSFTKRAALEGSGSERHGVWIMTRRRRWKQLRGTQQLCFSRVANAPRAPVFSETFDFVRFISTQLRRLPTNAVMKILPRSLHFLGMLLVFNLVSALQGQTPQNPTPINGPTTIHTPGYYRLTRNIATAATTGNIITVQAHNVTIDFNGFFIIGPVNTASQVVGVYANGIANLTIKDGSISFCQVGIQLHHTINHIIENMRITNIYNYGIYFQSASPGSYVTNCQFSQIGGSTAGTLFDGIAIFGFFGDQTIQARDNVINKVTGPSTGYGIVYAFAVRNVIANSDVGVYGGKYQNNLTSNVTTPFTSGVDAGGNN